MVGFCFFLLLLLAFGAVNFWLGVLAAGMFGVGPLRNSRIARFLSEPMLRAPAWLLNFRWWIPRQPPAEGA